MKIKIFSAAFLIVLSAQSLYAMNELCVTQSAPEVMLCADDADSQTGSGEDAPDTPGSSCVQDARAVHVEPGPIVGLGEGPILAYLAATNRLAREVAAPQKTAPEKAAEVLFDSPFFTQLKIVTNELRNIELQLKALRAAYDHARNADSRVQPDRKMVDERAKLLRLRAAVLRRQRDGLLQRRRASSEGAIRQAVPAPPSEPEPETVPAQRQATPVLSPASESEVAPMPRQAFAQQAPPASTATQASQAGCFCTIL